MTKICGIKLTHDAAVAGIEDGKLLFCVEIEKLRNNPRYSKMTTTDDVDDILEHFNFVPDLFVLDGWKYSSAISPAGTFEVAGYSEFDSSNQHPLDPSVFYPEDKIFGNYISFPHMSGHLMSAYVTSPFAKNRECCYFISWDGGQNPRVHYFDPGLGKFQFISSLFELYGIIYAVMGYYYGPYKEPHVWGEDIKQVTRYGRGYDVPGKLMSYIAQGTASPDLVQRMMGIYFRVSNINDDCPLGYNQTGIMEHEFMRGVKAEVESIGNLSDADVLASIHEWLKIMLVENACAIIPKGANLCFTGGSALNIKWNSALRNSGHFKAVYVPPFPNDSGSAIGAAACAMFTEDGILELDWSVYCGMEAQIGTIPEGWVQTECSISELAQFFATHPDTPVVFLNGRCEAGPRALGNRSILCSAIHAETKGLLNEMKRRESFRPVAPICLEQHAPEVFTPGTPDPFMLFDHRVKDEWVAKVPAIVHLDGTARLQTVNATENFVVCDLLTRYYEITGIPLLCNTSANLNGSGFFPDVESAMRWPHSHCIWHNNVLYTRGEEVL
jgi:carbamoyltransferase